MENMHPLVVIVHCNFCNKTTQVDTSIDEGVCTCSHCGQEVAYISGCVTGAIKSKPNPFMDEVGFLFLDTFEEGMFKREYHVGIPLTKAKTLVTALMDKCVSTQVTWDGFISKEPAPIAGTEDDQEEEDQAIE